MRLRQIPAGYEVEWCAGCPKIAETDDADLDNADYHIRDFRTLDEARTFAKSVVGQDFFGSVRICQFEYQHYEIGKPGMFREYIADPEYVEA